MSRAGIAIVSLLFLIIFACQKKDKASSEALTKASSNDVILSNTMLSYGDSIFYTSATVPNKIIFPVSRPSVTGYFAANFPGLNVDSATGRINISKSESGLRYLVYYFSLNNEPLDSTPITISGIDYKDRIYDISTEDPEEQIALPVYNMTPDLPLPCTNGNSLQGCKFDETDLNNDSIEDIPGVNRNKLIVDIHNGSINLKESFTAGVFGPILYNGKKKDMTIYYRLDDGSNRTLNKITIRLVYFRSRADIPESMLLEIYSRNERYQLIGTTSTGTSELLYYATYSSTPTRPPLIVIVSGL